MLVEKTGSNRNAIRFRVRLTRAVGVSLRESHFSKTHLTRSLFFPTSKFVVRLGVRQAIAKGIGNAHLMVAYKVGLAAHQHRRLFD